MAGIPALGTQSSLLLRFTAGRLAVCLASNMPSIDSYDVSIPAQGLRVRPRRVDLAPFDPASSPSSSSVSSSTLAYLSIPYARPPVGPLRWRPPQRPAPPKDHAEPVLQESKWARDACQNIRDQLSITVGREAHKTSIGQSEDCLTLNVWVPEEIKKAHAADSCKVFPVGVWIHGALVAFSSP
jgi:Carboxylesterase family